MKGHRSLVHPDGHVYGLRLAQDTPDGPEYDWKHCIYCGAPLRTVVRRGMRVAS